MRPTAALGRDFLVNAAVVVLEIGHCILEAAPLLDRVDRAQTRLGGPLGIHQQAVLRPSKADVNGIQLRPGLGGDVSSEVRFLTGFVRILPAVACLGRIREAEVRAGQDAQSESNRQAKVEAEGTEDSARISRVKTVEGHRFISFY